MLFYVWYALLRQEEERKYYYKLMNMNKIIEYKNKHKLTWEQLAEKIGITRQSLNDIVVTRSSNIKVETALRIKKVTGLNPWEYLDGLDDLKKHIK